MMLGSFEIDVLQKNVVSVEIQHIFYEATNIEGVKRELMLYLGKQVVHGMNYAYISRSVPAILDPLPYYELIIISLLIPLLKIYLYEINTEQLKVKNHLENRAYIYV